MAECIDVRWEREGRGEIHTGGEQRTRRHCTYKLDHVGNRSRSYKHGEVSLYRPAKLHWPSLCNLTGRYHSWLTLAEPVIFPTSGYGGGGRGGGGLPKRRHGYSRVLTWFAMRDFVRDGWVQMLYSSNLSWLKLAPEQPLHSMRWHAFFNFHHSQNHGLIVSKG
jgi:hypothetical protein